MFSTFDNIPPPLISWALLPTLSPQNWVSKINTILQNWWRKINKYDHSRAGEPNMFFAQVKFIWPPLSKKKLSKFIVI